jgi:hypothetical protein
MRDRTAYFKTYRSRREVLARRCELQRLWAIANKGYVEAAAEERKVEAEKLRLEIIEVYGGRCACCGEHRHELLTMDHVGGRKSVGHSRNISGNTLYRWLKKHGFPKDLFRLLCFNCNCSIGIRGYCPHERERESEKCA